jgi:hypothetical protein
MKLSAECVEFVKNAMLADCAMNEMSAECS